MKESMEMGPLLLGRIHWSYFFSLRQSQIIIFPKITPISFAEKTFVVEDLIVPDFTISFYFWFGNWFGSRWKSVTPHEFIERWPFELIRRPKFIMYYTIHRLVKCTRGTNCSTFPMIRFVRWYFFLRSFWFRGPLKCRCEPALYSARPYTDN